MLGELTTVDRGELLKLWPPPDTITNMLSCTDGRGDMDVLWAIVKELRPRLAVELGSRGCTSTRIIREAMPKKGKMWAVDPDGVTVRAHLPEGVTFIEDRGENVFWTWSEGPVDLLMIDTDPHSFLQTTMWLDTWISKYLSPHGLAVFHDTITSEVGPALHEWTRVRPRWKLVELGTNHGLGVLRFMGG